MVRVCGPRRFLFVRALRYIVSIGLHGASFGLLVDMYLFGDVPLHLEKVCFMCRWSASFGDGPLYLARASFLL